MRGGWGCGELRGGACSRAPPTIPSWMARGEVRTGRIRDAEPFRGGVDTLICSTDMVFDAARHGRRAQGRSSHRRVLSTTSEPPGRLRALVGAYSAGAVCAPTRSRQDRPRSVLPCHRCAHQACSRDPSWMRSRARAMARMRGEVRRRTGGRAPACWTSRDERNRSCSSRTRIWRHRSRAGWNPPRSGRRVESRAAGFAWDVGSQERIPSGENMPQFDAAGTYRCATWGWTHYLFRGPWADS